jgi:hypothetical protein
MADRQHPPVVQDLAVVLLGPAFEPLRARPESGIARWPSLRVRWRLFSYLSFCSPLTYCPNVYSQLCHWLLPYPKSIFLERPIYQCHIRD